LASTSRQPFDPFDELRADKLRTSEYYKDGGQRTLVDSKRLQEKVK